MISHQQPFYGPVSCWAALFAILLIVSASPAWGQTEPFKKLGPVARQFTSFSSASKQAERQSSMSRHFAVTLTGSNQAEADIFVRLTNPAAAQALESAGLNLQAVAGPIAAARGTADAIMQAAALPDVQYLELSSMSRPMSDAGVTDIRANLVRQQYGLEGEGVIIGIVDTGIDFSHPDLRDETGTRILYAWDMSATDGGSPTNLDPAFDWGKEYSKADLDALPEGMGPGDANGGEGHGTHVAGVATGNGTLNDENSGVAPASQLIVVKATRDPDSGGLFSDADIVAAVDYIFQRADELGMPAVVNLSLGHYNGSLDGTSMYEEALAALTGPGHILVAAAGNGGSDTIHAGGELEAGTDHEAFIYPNNATRTDINGWYAEGAIESFMLRAYREDDNGKLGLVASSANVPVGFALGLDNPVPLESNGLLLGYVTLDAITTSDPNNGDGRLLATITNDGVSEVDISETVWAIEASTVDRGRADFWALDGAFADIPPTSTGATTLLGDRERTIASPSTSPAILSVGSYVTRNAINNVFGDLQPWENPDDGSGTTVPDIGQRSYFSGVGPTRDNRLAPDILAPGEVVVSLLSSQLTPGVGYESSLVQEGGSYFGRQGTSIAAAHATGVLALMLEADPELTPDAARNVLQRTARADLQTGPLPNNQAGFGKLDALQAIERTLEIAQSAAIAMLDKSEVSIGVPPEFDAVGSFSITNTGTGELSYTIAFDDLGPASFEPPSFSAEASGFRTANQWQALPTFESEPGPALFRPQFAYAPKGSQKGQSQSPVLMANNTIVFDDGNHNADAYWGMGDNGGSLFWGNEFVSESGDFTLEKVRFYMQTDTLSFNDVWVAVYNRSSNKQLSGDIFPLSVAPDGAWFEIELTTPLTFVEGDRFFIELGGSSFINLPAGIDANAITVAKSFYAGFGQTYRNLVLDTSTGFQAGAFLVRAIGTFSEQANLAPVALAELSTFTPIAQQALSFNANDSYDADGAIVSVKWDFGDGETSSEWETTHTYDAPGTYNVRLEVTDNEGSSAEALGQVTVYVSDPSLSTRLSITPNSGTVGAGSVQAFEVTFDTSDLGEGIYRGQVSITSNSGYLFIPIEVEISNRFVSTEDETELPKAVALDQNYPNPFNPTTNIDFTLPGVYDIELSVFDAAGRQVRILRQGTLGPGQHQATWDATDQTGRPLASGVYFYRLQASALDGPDVQQLHGKMVLVK